MRSPFLANHSPATMNARATVIPTASTTVDQSDSFPTRHL